MHINKRRLTGRVKEKPQYLDATTCKYEIDVLRLTSKTFHKRIIRT